MYTTSSGYALCQDGRLYVWGNNSHGQPGIGSNESVSADSPIDISSLLDGRIQYVSIGSSSIALTDNGRVYTWGSDDDGQLGVGGFNDRLSPTDITESFQLDNDDRVIVACMASLSSFALTNNGRVYTWGSDYGGQLGNGYSASNDQSLPVEITDRFNLDPS